MAIVYGASSPWSATTSPIVDPLAISIGDAVLVFVGLNPSTCAVSTVTDDGASGGNSYTKIGEVSDGTIKAELWRCDSATKTAANITVAITGTITDANVSAARYTGVLSFGPPTNSSGTTSNPSMSGTTQDANNFMVTYFAANDGNGWTVGTGNLRSSDANVSMAAAIVDNTAVSPGSVTCSATHSVSNAHWVGLMQELRTVAAAAYVPRDLQHSPQHQAVVAQ